MSVSGVGGAQGGFDIHDAGASPAQAEAAASSSSASAVRGSGAALPRDVASAVTSYDEKHHGNRNIPDRSYGPTVLSSSKNTDGSWNVTVGSSPTSIAGPLPGQKPFDLVTYLYQSGKVSVEANPPSGGADAAATVEKDLAKGDGKSATADAIAAGKTLYGPSLGFPRLVDNPPAADVKSFKDMLAKLEKDGKLGDLGKAAAKEEQRELAGFGGRRPMDWYGSKEVLDALVGKYGSASQQKALKAGETAATTTTTPAVTAKQIQDAYDSGAFSTNATRADLPKAAQKQFDADAKQSKQDGYDTTAEKATIGGQTFFAVGKDDSDTGDYHLNIFDASGKLAASGGGTEHDGEYWNPQP